MVDIERLLFEYVDYNMKHNSLLNFTDYLMKVLNYSETESLLMWYDIINRYEN